MGSVLCWFNTTAFAKNNPTNGSPVDGTSPRNFLNQPAYRDLDLAISRTFKVSERFNLQFRGEALNVLNMVSLNAPAATVGTANFGQIGTAQTMRQIQVGLRLAF